MIKSEVLLYIVSIIEAYKNQYSLEGKQTVDIFKKYNIFDYIVEFYDVLHTQSIDYGIQDVHEFILRREEKM